MTHKLLYRLRGLQKAEVNLPVFLARTFLYRLQSKKIYAHQNTVIKGIGNISTEGRLFIGTNFVGFLNNFDRTFFNVEGRLIIKSDVHIGKSSRVLVCKGATCILEDCMITGMTNLIIAHSLTVGAGSVISWGCEFLDNDWHKISYEGQKTKDPGIIIGENVWIGSYVKIFKGVRISDNSVIAAGSVVVHSFEEKNVLIAGNPAKIIKRNVDWKK